MTLYRHNKVYIIDDDSSVRKSLERLLAIGNFDIKTYPSATKFLENITLEMNGCLILDVRLPDMNGLKLQEYLKINNSKLKVIFISAYDDLDVCRQAMKAGAENFLLKPIRGHKLIDAVYNALSVS